LRRWTIPAGASRVAGIRLGLFRLQFDRALVDQAFQFPIDEPLLLEHHHVGGRIVHGEVAQGQAVVLEPQPIVEHWRPDEQDRALRFIDQHLPFRITPLAEHSSRKAARCIDPNGVVSGLNSRRCT
jgi:hypothetical protein